MIRCGILIIYKGYAKANNKFLKPYDANKSRSYIVYLDASNLYGHNMMKLLSNELLEWVNPKDFINNYLNNYYKYIII